MAAAVSCGVRNNLITGGAPSGFHAASADNIEFQFNDCFGNLPVDIVTLVADSTNLSRDPRYVDPGTFDYRLGVHSGGIDTGDPSILDTDGSRSDVGAFGGPLAETYAPTYVRGLLVEALNDTTLGLSWEPRIPGGFDYYAVYSDTAEAFVPDITNFIGTVEASAEGFEHSPVSGCRYYRVNIVGDSGYAGGYSNVAGACVEGGTTDSPDLPPLANNLSQNYPNPFNLTSRLEQEERSGKTGKTGVALVQRWGQEPWRGGIVRCRPDPIKKGWAYLSRIILRVFSNEPALSL